MNTILCRIKSAARTLLLLIIAGQSPEAFPQIVFEARVEEPTDKGYLRTISMNSADVEGDGDLDLLVTGTRDNGIGTQTFISELYVNNGDASFSLVPDNFLSAEHSAFADVDGDQDMDVLIYSFSPLDFVCDLFLNDGEGNFTPVSGLAIPKVNRGKVKFFHYDNDDLLDILIAGQADGRIVTSIYRNLDDGVFEEVQGIGFDIKFRSSAMEIGDIDGDGDNDVIFSGERPGGPEGTFVFKNSTGTFSDWYQLNDLTRGDINLGDFNNDGFLDLIVAGENLQDTYVTEYYLNNGQGSFTKAAKQPFQPALLPNLETADFDGDGNLDVFIGGRDLLGNNGNVLYRNDGSGNFEESQKLRVMSAGGTTVGNFDGRGLQDILIFGKFDIIGGPELNLVYLNQTVINGIPVVSEINLTGEHRVGSQLLGTYAFSDPEEAPDQSNLRWYRALDISGKEKVEIEEATSSTYIPGEMDVDKYISFEVVPFDGIDEGAPVQSQWVGPILLPLPKLSVKGNNILVEEEAPASLVNYTHFGGTTRNNELQRSFILENTGSGELIISSIEVIGNNSPDFSILENEISTIAPGASKTFSIKFAPLGLGVRTAEIRIDNNDERNRPFIFKISGEGLNSAPVFTSMYEVNHYENLAGMVLDINASNGEGGADDLEVEYAITGGEDESSFVIDPANGQLSFISNPDFENPLDFDKDNIYRINITANDNQDENNVTSQTILVSVMNIDESPTASCIGSFTVFLDPNGIANLSAEDIDNQSSDDMGISEKTIMPSQFSCADIGFKEVVLMVKDTGGNSSFCTTQVEIVDNQKPEIIGINPLSVQSGPGGCGAFINIVPPDFKDNCSGTIISGVRKDGLGLNEMFPVGTTEIIWTATDLQNLPSEPFSQLVTVTNKTPEALAFTGPDGPREIGTPIFMKGNFSDENTEKVTWKAYNGNMVVQEYSASATGSESSYTFENLPAGVYTIILEVRDHCGMTEIGNSDYVVLYDPNGGFVTGGGWFDSPPGALTGSEAIGKAHFGFNAKYQNGKTEAGEVGGNTSFQFKTGDLDFKSDSHEKMSLVVSGGFKATYKGLGSVNGKGGYHFMVTVIDAEETSNYPVDLFRIKIWNSEGVLYDNMLEAEENADPTTSIGGGSIVIHKPKSGTVSKAAETLNEKELAEGLEIFTAYPNPMEETTTVTFKVDKSAGARLKIYDLTGREIRRLFQGEVQKGEIYDIELKNLNLMKGVYIYRLELDSGEAYQKQLLVN